MTTDSTSAWRVAVASFDAALTPSSSVTTPVDASSTRAALETLRVAGCEDIVEHAFLRSFERAMDAEALRAWRDACAVPAGVSLESSWNDESEDDDDGGSGEAGRELAGEAWTTQTCRREAEKFRAWIERARATAKELSAVLRGDVMHPAAVAFARAFETSVGTMCASRGPPRLSAILSAWYRARAKEFDAAVRKRWGETSDDDEESGRMETSVLERQTSIGADIASGAEVMGREWSESVGSMRETLAACHESLGEIAEAAAARALGECVRKHVVRRCKGEFDTPKLRPTLRWVRAVPLEFFKTALRLSHGDGRAIESWKGRLEYAVHEHLGALRIHELFDIIVEYPDSMPAITDLRTCLQNTTLHAALVDSFVAATRARLLHAGASTVDIVQQYIGTIKTLLELDPSGVVLELVSDPIKEYLRERKDTIRCVVTMLTDDGGDGDGDGEGALYVELGRLARGESMEIVESSVAVPMPSETVGGADNLDRMDSITAEMVAIAAEMHEDGPADLTASQQQVMSGWEAWEPEPVETEAAASRGRRRKGGDIIGLLVDIYGSKELFINEYRTMLAEKLLGKSSYDTEREMHALELLKIRFGETSLHNCEVMLKDFADSKRANTNIKTRPTTGTPSARDERMSALLSSTPVEATIVSSLFWPAFSSDTTEFKLPAEIQEHMDAYAKRYHQLKAPRKMEWKTSLGTVVMDVTHNDNTFEVSVNPLQASILYHFQFAKDWSARDLAAKLGVSDDVLRKRIVVWLNNGVLIEKKDGRHEVFYSLTDPSDRVDDMQGVHDDEEHVSAVASAEETAAAEMMVYEQYVMGMLTNFPSLPLDRIHNMLKMFVVDPVYDKSVDDLEAFLLELVAQDKLIMDGAAFAKKK